MKKLSKADMQFTVEQLRKDAVIFTLESIAVTILAMLLFSGLQFIAFQYPVMAEQLPLIAELLLIIPLAFWVFVVFGNMWRWMKINKLERLL